MILVLRGHIRDAFQTKYLKHLIKNIYEIDPQLQIYIHTWNVFSNNISWRRIESNNTRVSTNTIYNYFGELSPLIKYIMIDDDSKIQLIGNVSGKINDYKMPILGWKNYWYGKFQIINYLYLQNIQGTIINMRFDIMVNKCNRLTNDQIIPFIRKNKNNEFTKNKFIYDEEHSGIDNIYMGNIHTMYKLTHRFYYHLDDILQTHHQNVQENLVFIVNNE
jgi:hypothetical protein